MTRASVCRAVRWSVAVVLALAGTAACTAGEHGEHGGPSGGHGGPNGGHTPKPRVVAALRAAERALGETASARVRSTTEMGADLSMTANGVLGWRGGTRGTFTITYTGGTTAEVMRELGTTSMEARYLSDAYYAHMGEKFAEQTGGRHWIRYGYDDLADLGGPGADLAGRMRTTTPGQSVRLLLASGAAEQAGEETVAGRATTHYTATVRVADLAAGALKEQLSRAGVTTGTVDVWIDGRGLLVKKRERGTTPSGSYTQTAYYSDYGVKVTADRPPAGDTEDFTKLLARQSATAPAS
jgi:hypothetical protein